MFYLATCENVKPETTVNYLKNYWSPSNSDAIPNIVPNSVKSHLSMEHPTLIGLPLDRANIKLIVESCPNVRELCRQLTDVLMAKQTATLKLLYFATHCSIAQTFLHL